MGGSRVTSRFVSVAAVPFATVFVACASEPRGSDPSTLSPADSAAIWTAVTGAMIEQAESDPDSVRIWIAGALIEDPEGPYREDAPQIPRAVRDQLIETFDGARIVDDWANIFELVSECPPGESVRMPGHGCPIRDDGIVVSLGPLSVAADGMVTTQASVTRSQSVRSGAEVVTWAEGFRITLERSEDGSWITRDVTDIWIT